MQPPKREKTLDMMRRFRTEKKKLPIFTLDVKES